MGRPATLLMNGGRELNIFITLFLVQISFRPDESPAS